MRNRIKRLLREIMREILKDIEGGFDLVFVARQGAENISLSNLKYMVKELLSRASIKGKLKAFFLN